MAEAVTPEIINLYLVLIIANDLPYASGQVSLIARQIKTPSTAVTRARSPVSNKITSITPIPTPRPASSHEGHPPSPTPSYTTTGSQHSFTVFETPYTGPASDLVVYYVPTSRLLRRVGIPILEMGPQEFLDKETLERHFERGFPEWEVFKVKRDWETACYLRLYVATGREDEEEGKLRRKVWIHAVENSGRDMEKGIGMCMGMRKEAESNKKNNLGTTANMTVLRKGKDKREAAAYRSMGNCDTHYEGLDGQEEWSEDDEEDDESFEEDMEGSEEAGDVNLMDMAESEGDGVRRRGQTV